MKVFDLAFLHVLLLIGTCLPLHSGGQVPVYPHYGVDEGLPTSEILDIQQDNDGFIWITTAAGICRYDGYHFRTFTTKDGLPSISNVISFKDINGRIWFSSYEGYLSYTCNGKVWPHPLNRKISEISGHNRIISVYVNKQGELFFKPYFKNLTYRITTDHHILPYAEEQSACSGGRNLYLQEVPGGLLWGIHQEERTGVPGNGSTKGIALHDGFVWLNYPGDFRELKAIREQPLNFKLISVKIPGGLLMAISKNLYLLSGKDLRLIRCFRTSITTLMADKSGSLWVGTSYDGAFQLDAFTFKPLNDPVFKGKTITRIIQDREGNYWFSTLEDGIFLVPSFFFHLYSHAGADADLQVLSLENAGNELIISARNKKVYSCTRNSANEFILKEKNIDQERTTITDISAHHDGSVWYLGSTHLKYSRKGVPALLGTVSREFGYQVLEGRNDTTFVLYDESIQLYCGNRQAGTLSRPGLPAHPRVLLLDQAGVLWIGTLNGLYSYQKGKFVYHGEEDPLLGKRITDLKAAGGFLLVGSREDGVYLKGPTGGFRITDREGLSSNMINRIYVRNDSDIWITTNNGLNNVRFRQFTEKGYRVTYYTTWDGLPTNQINGIEGFSGMIWLGTDRGLVGFDPGPLRKSEVPPIIHIEKIEVNEKDTAIAPYLDLKFDQNTITFTYKAICFRDPGRLTYRIQLQGLDKDWVTTTGTTARYSGLQPGEYSFRIKASAGGGIWTKELQVAAVNIRKHYTQTSLFLAGMILAGIVILSSVFLFIIRYQRARARTRRELLLSEIKALRSQMNPHFIFNSLNSIQYFILGKEHEHGDEYLASFAALIRKILENSKHNLIPLCEEIETIRLYLELEKLRFEEKFGYTIDIDPGIDTYDTRIPPMMIQPHLENAIWHGLMPKKSAGGLRLSVKLQGDSHLLCMVEDNGIGREESSRINTRRKKHNSMGVKNVEERIMLFNKINKTDMSLKIIDLYNDDRTAAGTRIEILIPLSMAEPESD